MSTIFDYKDYRKYLEVRLSDRSKGAGQKAQFARAVGCQNTYVSRILKGVAQLSLDQAWLAAEYFSLSSDETDYFLNLIQLERASHHRLKSHILAQLELIHEKRKNLKNRIRAGEVPDAGKVRYYSSWIFSAVHACTAVPSLQFKDAICEHLKISKKKLNETLEFLLSFKLVAQKGDRFILGSSSLHLAKDSVLTSKLHTNWRIQAIASLDREVKNDLHYSILTAISERDAEKIHRLLIDAIARCSEIVDTTKSETLRCICVDLFSL